MERESKKNERNKRLLQAALLVLIFGASVALLVWLVGQSRACGDGVCMQGEEQSCPIDCASGIALAGTPVDIPPPKIEREGTTRVEKEPPKPEPKPQPKPKPKPKPKPQPTTPGGRCDDARFVEVARKVVKECTVACQKDSNPIVDLDWDEFEQLFGRPDDAGVASHFSLFGCNRYGAGRRSCLGFGSHTADPARCAAGPRGANCRKYAEVLKRDLEAFLDANRDAGYLILLGAASRTGNVPAGMSEANARLAEQRALDVQEVVNEYRRRHGLTAMQVFAVVMDNARQNYHQSPAFRRIIEEQLTKAGAKADERGFTPDSENAVNRSVMAVAIRCKL